MEMSTHRTEIESFLHQLLEILEEDVTYEIEEDSPDGLYVNLIGNLFSVPEEGPALTSLEHLLRAVVRRKTSKDVEIVLDINGAVKQRRAELIRFALGKAEEVRRERKRLRLNAMPSHERRTIHVALANFPGVKTYSIGDADGRRVVIEPDDV